MKFSNVFVPALAFVPRACLAFAPLASNVQLQHEKATSDVKNLPVRLLINSRLQMASDVSHFKQRCL
jgi:hypothetical protein